LLVNGASAGLAFLLWFVLISWPLALGEEKSATVEEAVTITRVTSGNRVSLIVRNRAACAATVTLKVSARNGSITWLKPETETYPGHSQVEVVRMVAVDPAKRWRINYRFKWVRGDMHAKHDDSVLYRLPYESGKSHRVIQGYDGPTHRDHDRYAVDFAMRVGTAVCAARDGVVVILRESSEVGGPEEEYRDKSNFVSIAHADGTIAEYYHLKYEGVLVEIGQRVKAGDKIGLSGNTGFSTRPHLHFGVYSAVDGEHIQSHPLTFTTRQGNVSEPRRGRSYTAL
jgi:murein DD-endopeptidase MepM/ murein hydrolase activator NlpD